jgi:hypothetical protein
MIVGEISACRREDDSEIVHPAIPASLILAFPVNLAKPRMNFCGSDHLAVLS